MPYPASACERQRQLSTSLSTNTPSQSKMMRSGSIIGVFSDPIRAYTQIVGNNPHFRPKWSLSRRSMQVPCSFGDNDPAGELRIADVAIDLLVEFVNREASGDQPDERRDVARRATK